MIGVIEAPEPAVNPDIAEFNVGNDALLYTVPYELVFLNTT